MGVWLVLLFFSAVFFFVVVFNVFVVFDVLVVGFFVGGSFGGVDGTAVRGDGDVGEHLGGSSRAWSFGLGSGIVAGMVTVGGWFRVKLPLRWGAGC